MAQNLVITIVTIAYKIDHSFAFSGLRCVTFCFPTRLCETRRIVFDVVILIAISLANLYKLSLAIHGELSSTSHRVGPHVARLCVPFVFHHRVLLQGPVVLRGSRLASEVFIQVQPQVDLLHQLKWRLTLLLQVKILTTILSGLEESATFL